MAKRKKSQRRGGSTSRSGPSRSSSARAGSSQARQTPSGRWSKLSGAFDPTLLGLWLLVALPPLVFLPGLSDNFRLPKLLLTELLGLFSLLLLSLRLWRAERLDWSFLKAPAVRWVVPIVAAGSLGLFFGEHPETTRRALPSLWIGGACLVGWSLALRPRERRMLLMALLAPSALLAGFAVLQFHDLFDPFSFQGRVTDRTGLTSLAGGAFDLSGYLVLPLLIAQAALPAASKRWRLALGVFLAVSLWASIASRTVTALAALILGSLILWRRSAQPRRLLGGAAVGAAVFLVLVTVGPLKERAQKITASLQKGEINRLLTGRLDAWRGAGWMLEQKPILGVGHGAFRSEFGSARLELSARGVKFFRGQKQVYFSNAHSDFLDALAEWGLVGGAVLAACGFFFIRHLRRRWRLEAEAEQPRGPPQAASPSDASQSAEGVGAGAVGVAGAAPPRPAPRDFELAALVALVVLGSTYFPFHVALIAYPWLLFLSGLLAAPSDGARPPTGAGDADGSGAGHSTQMRSRLLMVALLAAVTLAGTVRFEQARQRLGASRLVAVAEGSILQMAQGGAVPPPLLRRNLELLRRAAEMDPADVGVPIAEGGHFFLLKRHSAAIRAYERAAELEMRSEIFANLARVYLQSGDRDKAIEAIETAITLDNTQRKTFGDTLREEKRRRRQEMNR